MLTVTEAGLYAVITAIDLVRGELSMLQFGVQLIGLSAYRNRVQELYRPPFLARSSAPTHEPSAAVASGHDSIPAT